MKTVFGSNILDKETGEIVTITEEFVVKGNEPYFMTYTKDIVKLTGMPAWTHDVLYLILTHMEYGTNIIYTNQYLKKKIIEELGCSMNTVNKAVWELHKKKILLKVERGVYMVNPNYFGKGSWKDIVALRLDVSRHYDEKGVKIKVTTMQQYSNGEEMKSNFEI